MAMGRGWETSGQTDVFAGSDYATVANHKSRPGLPSVSSQPITPLFGLWTLLALILRLAKTAPLNAINSLLTFSV